MMTPAPHTPPLPDLLVIGTQKAGTTWLMRKLGAHPGVFMAPRQLHYFDREFHRGEDWYRAQFAGAAPGQLVGEKTTEYFDTATIDTVAPRIATTCPETRLIVILRNPVERAWSALVHHVNAGLIALPRDPETAVFDDTPEAREGKRHFRFIERGYYARQLAALYAHVDPAQVLVLVFERDIVADPEAGWARVCAFLDLPEVALTDARKPENQVRLSPLAARLSRLLRPIPRARGVVRRLDRLMGGKPWTPKMTPKTRQRLADIYAGPNHDLAVLLGEPIDAWKDTTP